MLNRTALLNILLLLGLTACRDQVEPKETKSSEEVEVLIKNCDSLPDCSSAGREARNLPRAWANGSEDAVLLDIARVKIEKHFRTDLAETKDFDDALALVNDHYSPANNHYRAESSLLGHNYDIDLEVAQTYLRLAQTTREARIAWTWIDLRLRGVYDLVAKSESRWKELARAEIAATNVRADFPRLLRDLDSLFPEYQLALAKWERLCDGATAASLPALKELERECPPGTSKLYELGHRLVLEGISRASTKEEAMALLEQDRWDRPGAIRAIAERFYAPESSERN